MSSKEKDHSLTPRFFRRMTFLAAFVFGTGLLLYSFDAQIGQVTLFIAAFIMLYVLTLVSIELLEDGQE